MNPEDTAFAVFLSIMLVALVWAIIGAMRHCLREQDRVQDGRRVVYVVGSLRNERVPQVAEALRDIGYDVFDDWYAAGEHADDSLRDYYTSRGLNFKEALDSYAARHIFEFDKRHLQRAGTVVLVMPAGKSGFLELGWALGQGKRGYILFNGDPDRIDIMMQFADGICYSIEELKEALQNG